MKTLRLNLVNSKIWRLFLKNSNLGQKNDSIFNGVNFNVDDIKRRYAREQQKARLHYNSVR